MNLQDAEFILTLHARVLQLEQKVKELEGTSKTKAH
jgi:hypothetical protein